ncbi:MAG: metallophosphoesterase family protein [Flavobacteriaceae bacterium]
MRTLVVGDIHGGLKALKQLINKVSPRVTDQFIFLGDYVDGWSESAQTISFLIEFSKEYRCIFLRGNHDELTYKYLKHRDDNPLWLNHGGRATQISYEHFSSEAIENHLLFFQKLINFHIDSQNRLFVHAGFTNLNGPQHEYYPNLVYWDRTLWEMVCSLDKNLSKKDALYPARLQLFSEIYIGHTPTTRLGKTNPLNFANVWNIDTGAAFKGPLSVIDVDTKEVWQSDPVYKLYPSEKGRN